MQQQELKDLLCNNLASLPVPFSDDGLPAEPARILYGRGGRFPGFCDINIDFFPPLVFAVLYREFSDAELGLTAEVVQQVFPGCPLMIQDRSVRPAVTRLIEGEVPEEMTVTEAGLEYYLHPGRGQNPGFFIDMREGRRYLRSFIQKQADAAAESSAVGGPDGVNVLNLFAYTCAFSVSASAAGAAKVVNIDKNRRSLDIGRRNHRLNSRGSANAVFLPHDIFKSFGRLRKEGPYSLIIADPPPSQKGSFMLLSDYPRLLRRLPDMLTPEGVIMLTHNGPGWSWDELEAMTDECLPGFGRRERLQPPADFMPAEDGRGLKILCVGR